MSYVLNLGIKTNLFKDRCAKSFTEFLELTLSFQTMFSKDLFQITSQIILILSTWFLLKIKKINKFNRQIGLQLAAYFDI